MICIKEASQVMWGFGFFENQLGTEVYARNLVREIERLHF